MKNQSHSKAKTRSNGKAKYTHLVRKDVVESKLIFNSKLLKNQSVIKTLAEMPGKVDPNKPVVFLPVVLELEPIVLGQTLQVAMTAACTIDEVVSACINFALDVVDLSGRTPKELSEMLGLCYVAKNKN